MTDFIWIAIALVFVVPFFLYVGVWLVAWLQDMWNLINGRETHRSERFGGSNYGPNATDPSDWS